MKSRIRENYEPFSIGQKVWLECRNLKMPYNKKITTKYKELFQITEVLSPVNYRLKSSVGWKQHDMFHAEFLTPYKKNGTHGPNFTQPPSETIDNEEEWEIERIVRHRGKKKIIYQVKWTGYEELTWEPEEYLTHAVEVIRDYWKGIVQKWKP